MIVRILLSGADETQWDRWIGPQISWEQRLGRGVVVPVENDAPPLALRATRYRALLPVQFDSSREADTVDSRADTQGVGLHTCEPTPNLGCDCSVLVMEPGDVLVGGNRALFNVLVDVLHEGH